MAPRTGHQPKYVGSAFSNKAPCAPLVGKKNTTAIRYWGSGAGREQYIVVDSGGGIPTYSTKNALSRYYDSLRVYNGPGQHRTPDSSLKNNLGKPAYMTAGGKQMYSNVSTQFPTRTRSQWFKRARD